MPNRRTLSLRSEQKAQLEAITKDSAKPYLRERAAALLKIAGGQSPHAVACHGLLVPRDPDPIDSWLNRYEAAGVSGLSIEEGRGRKPAFSPQYATEAEAKGALLQMRSAGK